MCEQDEVAVVVEQEEEVLALLRHAVVSGHTSTANTPINTKCK